MNIPWNWDISEIIARIAPNFGAENSWMLYVFAAFILGILLGGLVKGIAKLVLGLVMFSGFIVLVLMVMQKHDLLSMIASVIFGTIMLVVSFLVKVGKYPISKG
jgi:predicted branched-subunit amino acid permease